MSYATSLLMAYPPPYGPSTLLSDDLVQRSSLGAYYEPSVPDKSPSHLLNDDFTYNPMLLAPASYRSSNYPYLSSTTYRTPPITDWQRDIPGHSNVREYSDSMVTTSNPNTATSVVHSIDENTLPTAGNTFPNPQQNYNRFSSDVSHSPTRPRLPPSTNRSLPESSPMKHQNRSPVEGRKKDTTPIPPPTPVFTKQESNLQRNPTLIEMDKQKSAADTQPGISETKEDSPIDGYGAQQGWTEKIDHLQTNQVQRENEKAKISHAMSIVPQKPVAKEDKPRTMSYERREETYFDTIFDGNYYRKASTNPQNSNSSYQQALSSPKKSISPNKPQTTIFSQHTSPRKIPSYEPPSINRVQPSIATTKWRKQGVNQNQNDSQTPRDTVHKDTDERFREALQKFRADRAEQQQSEMAKSTAKRLDYGDYVRRSTREGSLHNIIKPLPWSDFLDMKKGNLYTLNKEEKKDLYNQSRSYAERVRYRNFALAHGGETVRTPRRLIPIPIVNEEPQSDEETSHEPANADPNDSKSVKSASSTKTFTKRAKSDRSSSSDGASSSTEEEDEVTSDFESNRKGKKRIYDSSVRTTSVTEENESDQSTERGSMRRRNRETDDDLFTVREEKTIESLESVRSKKR